MTTPHRTLLQQALDALEPISAFGRVGTKDVEQAKLQQAITALREALAAPEPEPVALESVHLTRDTKGMCVVRVNGRIAIQDNGDIIDHMATLEWFAAPPAAPAPAAPLPDGMVMVPREPTPEMIAAYLAANTQYWAEVDALPRTPVTKWRQGTPSDATRESYRAMIAASPAAPVVPLTDEQLAKIAVEDEFLLYCDQDSFNEIARAIEAAHGITGGKP